MHFKMQTSKHFFLNTLAYISLAKMQYLFIDFNVKFTYDKDVGIISVYPLNFFLIC